MQKIDETVIGRRGRLALFLSVVLPIAGCGSADARPQPSEPSVDAAVRILQDEAPGIRATIENGRVRVVTGRLATGRDGGASVLAFLERHGAILGASRSKLVPLDATGQLVESLQPIPLMTARSTGQPQFLLYRFGQAVDGVAVADARVDLLVHNNDAHTVVRVSSTTRDVATFSPGLDAAESLDTVKLQPSSKRAQSQPMGAAPPRVAKSLVKSGPIPVIWAGTSDAPAHPRLATSYLLTRLDDTGTLEKVRVIEDVMTASILHEESLLTFENATGSVKGMGTIDEKSPECTALAPLQLPYVHVGASPSGAATKTDGSGKYTLSFPDDELQTVSSWLRGEHFVVVDTSNARNSVVSARLAPRETYDLLHNPTGVDEFLRAQVNGYIHANRVRDWVLSIAPSFPSVATQTGFKVNVNLETGRCPGNAWYDGDAMNFCAAGRDPRYGNAYANWAFGSFVYHEYGHHLVRVGGSAQGAYGEGMADVVSMLLADSPNHGVGTFSNDCTTASRSGENRCVYSETQCSSCGNEPHDCGQVLMGAVWAVRNALLAQEPENYKQIVASLAINSILLHSGSSITPQIVADFLVLDDDDDDLGNGTPHRSAICAGFEAHGLSCPPLARGLDVLPSQKLEAAGPLGGPFEPRSFSFAVRNVGPDELAYTITPDVSWISTSHRSGLLASGASEVVSVIVDKGAAQLGVGHHAGHLTFTNTSTHAGDRTMAVVLSVGYERAYAWSLDTDPGWVRDAGWQYGVPSGLGAQDPSKGFTGTNVLGNNLSGNYASNMSEQRLFSDPIDCSRLRGVRLRFRRWLNVEASMWDHARVLVSTDSVHWTPVWQNVMSMTSDLDWALEDYDLSSLADGQRAVYIQWTMGPTDDSNEYGGWNLDDIEIWGIPNEPPRCASHAQCDDGVFCNGTERCVPTQGCVSGTPPCAADACDEVADRCTPPTCDDGKRNGGESDVDCGGNTCLACPKGRSCVDNNHCQSGRCQNGVCLDEPSLKASVMLTADWGTGYCAVLNLENETAKPTKDWNVGIDLQGTTIYTSWNGIFSSWSAKPNIRPVAPWNAVIPGHGVQNQTGFCAKRAIGNNAVPTVAFVARTS